jgi:hypothetical protein
MFRSRVALQLPAPKLDAARGIVNMPPQQRDLRSTMV